MARSSGGLCLGLLLGLMGCAPSVAPSIGSDEETWTAVDGRSYRLADWADSRCVVLVFLGRDCPISNAYAPELARLHEEYGARGVTWWGVYPDADVNEAEARQHAEEYGLNFPMFLDTDRLKARRFGATKMPEAVMLTPAGEVVYRGRIDDRYYELGRSRPKPTRQDLRDVLEAFLSGREVPLSHAPAIGCDIDWSQP
jgi:peroxiredoxin